jgi:hypothetical protein
LQEAETFLLIRSQSKETSETEKKKEGWLVLKSLLSFLLIASLFLFMSGCTEQNTLVPPFTFSQLLSKGVDVNGLPLTYQGYLDGNYDGLCFQVFDVNHFGLKDCMSVDANIPWSQLINFPTGCGLNQAVKIVGGSLVCVDLPTDANYLTKSNPVVDGNINWNDGNVIYVPCNASIATYVTNASVGDTLILGSCTYTITGDIDIAKAINIVGQGVGKTTISCATNSIKMFDISSDNVRISDLSIVHSAGGLPYGINVDGTAGSIFTNIRLLNLDISVTSSGTYGYGIRLGDAGGEIRDVTISVSGASTGCYGIARINAATAEAVSTLNVYNAKITMVGSGTNAIAFYNYDNSATEDLFMNLYSLRYAYILFMYIKCVFLCLKIH